MNNFVDKNIYNASVSFVDVGKMSWIDDNGCARACVGGINDNPKRDQFSQNRYNEFVAFCLMRMARVVEKASMLEVHWDIKSIHPKTLEAVKSIIHSRGEGQRINLSFKFGAWRHEFFQKADDALARIDQISNYDQAEPVQNTHIERHSVSQLNNAWPCLLHAYSHWRRLKGWSPKNFTQAKMDQELLHNALIFSENAQNVLTCNYIGKSSAYALYYGKQWCEDYIGRPIGFMDDDADYELQIIKSYYDAINDFKPRYEHVLTSIDRIGFDASWHSYERLILPIFMDDGRRGVVVVANADSQEISIPFMSANISQT